MGDLEVVVILKVELPPAALVENCDVRAEGDDRTARRSEVSGELSQAFVLVVPTVEVFTHYGGPRLGLLEFFDLFDDNLMVYEWIEALHVDGMFISVQFEVNANVL